MPDPAQDNSGTPSDANQPLITESDLSKNGKNTPDSTPPADNDTVQAALQSAEALVQQPSPVPANQVDPSSSDSSQKLSPSQPSGEKQDLLAILQRDGKISAENAEEVRMEHLKTGNKLDQIIVDKKLALSVDIAKAKAELFDVPFIHPNELTISTEAISLVPRTVARKFNILPFSYDKSNKELSVAMADPTDLQVIGFLEQKTSARVKPFASPREELSDLIEQRYGAALTSEVSKVIRETDLGKMPKSSIVTGGVIQEAPISKIINYVLDYAVNTRASDVHIEPHEEKTRIRYRIDGILYEKLVLPRQIHDALVSKIKIQAKLKIDERRLPQDGRFNFTKDDEEIDLRVSTMPTVHGEKVVMRLLKKTGGAKTLAELGLRGQALKNLEEIITRPYGIIIVCGPTGSGKTTTLYSVISKINSAKVNILTLEDPVEYQMVGVNQVQINPQAGLTFASGLRSFLRQDPNIIMVGEIRDDETTELAIQAALTGHLVFTTLHTNNSAGALPRLLDMDAEPFLLSSTINAILAQRVVRVICNDCKVAYPPPKEVIDDMKQTLGSMFPEDGTVSLQKGKGCAKCNTTGYQGRVGIFEVMLMNDKISRMIMERAPASDIEAHATKEGMITMKQDGYLKVLDGTTTMEEVLRVAQD